ncbi:stage II sporulation protein R [Syntrophomonas erecta]
MGKKIFMFIIMVTLVSCTGIYVKELRGTPLQDSVLRLHVVANSDTVTDQTLKIEVKDAVIAMMKEDFSGIDDLDQARQTAADKVPDIKQVAEEVVDKKGFTYPVKVSVGEYEFPTKSYGNFVLPQGDYQAVKVIIGEGQGRNWWCVLFPPLCMVSSSDKGLSMDSRAEARISFKCLELLPRGAKLGQLQNRTAE